MISKSYLSFYVGIFLTFANNCEAITANPYEPIIQRNVFALKPQSPQVTSSVEIATPPPGIELRGISTLFGRPQVLLNIKVSAKPPEQPKDRSLVLDVGQREGDVEVLEINPNTGVVRLRNQGNEISLNLKDNAAKPQSASPVAVPGGGNPTPGIIPPPAVTQPPGSSPLPNRQLRTDAPSTSGTTFGGVTGNAAQQSDQQQRALINRSPVENAALYSVNQAKNEELRRTGVAVPKLPRHPFMKSQAEQ